MADKKEHIIYSKADIENYLQGNMSKDAMHSMERAALQDPFLADAIEGYSFADAVVSTNHLADIESLISLNKQDAKIVVLKKKREWLKIAVAVFLFLGVGLISVLLLNNTNAKKSIVNSENSNTTLAENSKIEKPPVINNSPVENKEIADVNEKSKSKEYISLDKNSNKNESVVVNKSNTTLGLVSPSKQDENRIDDNPKTTASIDVNVNTTSVSSNQANINSKSAGPSANNNGNYNHPSLNTNKLEAPSKELALNNTDSKDVNKANSNSSVIHIGELKLKRDNTIEAVPITHFSSIKKAHKPVDFKLSKEDSLSVPVNGWAAFNDYLQKNSVYKTIVYDTAYKPVTITDQKTGEEIVGLEFDIDTNGKPEKIKITKSVDEETDAKAIELLKNGPKWQTSKKKAKGKVAIKF
ncbi:MAG: energy transducer TonB [Chitinophagaceae bacterium]